MPKEKNTPFRIVGVGASAGGLEALIELFANIPAGASLAFVVVQHLDRSHPVLSAEILARSTQLKVQEITQNTSLKAGHIYVMPSTHNVQIRGALLQLTPRAATHLTNLPIDLFLTSLSKAKKDLAIGVVLSGTGQDGTLGLQAIKNFDGLTFAQTLETAKYPGMPESAIETGSVDFVMTAKEIALSLINPGYINVPQPKHVGKGPLRDYLNTFDQILEVIKQSMGIDFAEYKKGTILRRIHRRMLVRRFTDPKKYLEFLTQNKDEQRLLFDSMLINVTSFFRDPEVYSEISQAVFAKILETKLPDSTIRIWAPGCSTGEEAYSIAILLTELIHESKARFFIQIFATDVSEGVIRKARAGVYANSSTRDIPEVLLKKYFDFVGDHFKIRKSIRDVCIFSQHDVTSDPPFAKLDFISCRNLLICLTPAQQRKTIGVFHYSLLPDGWLWLGRSESPNELSKLFIAIDKTNRFYQKSNVANAIRFTFPSKHPRTPQATAGKATGLTTGQALNQRPTLMASHAPDFRKDADDLILNRVAPPSVVINSQFEILHFRGRTYPFLESSSGQPSLNILKMIRPELLPGLRLSLQGCKAGNKSFTTSGLHFELDEKRIDLSIEILPTNPKVVEKDRSYLVVFRQGPKHSKAGAPALSTRRTHTESKKRIEELSRELSDIKDYEQSLIEQYENTQSELTSINEELQSTNEEFLSANEEIETAKEEIQSTNEELVTINDELQTKNVDLLKLTTDLNNLLASIGIPVVVVGPDFCIRRFSSLAKDRFNLISTDVGRPIGDVQPNLNINLGDLVREVCETLKFKELHVKNTAGKWRQVHIRPCGDANGNNDGAVITVFDIDEIKHRDIKLTEHIEHTSRISETVPLPLAEVDGSFVIQSANNAFAAVFQNSDGPVGRSFFEVVQMPPADQARLKAYISISNTENHLAPPIDIDTVTTAQANRRFLITSGKVKWPSDELQTNLLSFIDITDLRRLEGEREEALANERTARVEADNANRSKDIFLATLAHELRTPLSSILTWSQLISQGKVDFEKAKTGALVIEQSAKSQSRLIDDLLDVSRIILGKTQLKLTPTNPQEVIERAVKAILPTADKKKQHVICDLSPENKLINIDGARLEQIISNLLVNATKFSPVSSTIGVQLTYFKSPNGTVAQIIVSDNGIGISEESLGNIFDRFSQVNINHAGLGLGLSIVKSLTELMNGTVSAKNSVDGTGAIFTVQFPVIGKENDDDGAGLLTRSGSQDQASTTVDLNQAPKLSNISVLLVDDDNNAREAIKMLLESLGATVATASSVAEALTTLQTFVPSIIISDIQMPEQDGYAFMAELKAKPKSAGLKVPVIALTAFAAAQDLKKAMDAGFATHIAKPVDALVLAKAIYKLANKDA